MTKRKKIAAILASVVAVPALMAPMSAGAVTIINGSFEMGTNPGSFTSLANGSTAIDGWVVGGLGVDYIGTYWQAADGVRSIDLSANDKGSISQLLNGLIVGAQYTVSFSLAGNPDGGSATKVAVASDGGSQSSVFFFPQAGNTKQNMGWTNQLFTFTAIATTANLTFSATKNDAYGPALDNVSISGPVPEPGTWALFIGGFGLVGGAMRRARRTPLANSLV